MFKIRSSKMPLRLLRSFAANLLVCCPAFCLNRHFFIFGLRFPGLLCTAIVALTRSPRGFSKALAAYPLLSTEERVRVRSRLLLWVLSLSVAALRSVKFVAHFLCDLCDLCVRGFLSVLIRVHPWLKNFG